MLVKIIMKIFQKFFKNNQKLNANEIAIKDKNNKYKQLDKYLGNLSNLNTTDKSSLVNAINEVLNKYNVVYDETLESAQSSVSIPCNILEDGGAYEFVFIISPASTSTVSDYKLYFNDNNNLQYAENMFGATGSLNTEGNLVQSAVYCGYQKLIGDYWGSSINLKVPIILEGKIRLVDNIAENGKKIYFESQCNKMIHESQALLFHNAISVSNVENITKINLTQQSTSVANYGAGSRFILKKI